MQFDKVSVGQLGTADGTHDYGTFRARLRSSRPGCTASEFDAFVYIGLVRGGGGYATMLHPSLGRSATQHPNSSCWLRGTRVGG